MVEVCRKATTAADRSSTPSRVKASVFVTIDLEALKSLTKPGATIGGLDAGLWLGPETVRKLTCDGTVTPVVLGPDGQPLAFGLTKRLFTPTQVKALWLRDEGCSFPGCTIPPFWCDAHHAIHWEDGGPTDLDNGTLLCGRHHSIVHRDRLAATVTPTGVVWDRVPGSYDRARPRSDPEDPADGDAA